MKLALLCHNFSTWGGGIDFLRHVATSIAASTDGPSIAKAMILPSDDLPLAWRKVVQPAKGVLKQLLKGEVPRWHPLGGFGASYLRATFADLAADFEMVTAGSTYASQLRAASREGVDVVLPCIDVPPEGFDLPWVGYLFDFQHRYLPEFFRPVEVDGRNSYFALMLDKASDVVVNARSVADDIRRFHPAARAAVHVMPFSPCPQQAWLRDDLDVREQYGIDQPYFLISNQFWRHKGHETAFKAFAHYLQRGGEGLLVCTGETRDYRSPEFSAALCRMPAELGIGDRVRILGHIPKLHQIALVKTARAVVQPTTFEGGPGGGSAWDAIGLGIPVVASDIPVNIEIDSGDVTFFRAQDPTALCDALLSRPKVMQRRLPAAALWEAGLVRKRRCGDMLVGVARRVAKEG